MPHTPSAWKRLRKTEKRRKQNRAAAKKIKTQRRETDAAIKGTDAVGIGALAVGNIKYKTEAGLFKQMIESSKPINLDFRDAYTLAQKLAG